MPKLRTLSATEVARIFRKNNFVFILQTGSHLIFSPQMPGSDTATVPNKREIPVGTLKSIIDLSGLDEALFRK